MAGLTNVQKQIMRRIMTAPNLTMRSLFQMACELDVDYSYAWYCIRLLEARGLVRVEKPNGRDLKISFYKNSGGLFMEGIQKLRDDLQPAAVEYPRPNLTSDEQEKCTKAAQRINAIKDQYLRLVYVAAMVAENARLLKEINEHRQARGLEPLPSYDPDKKGG